jgi:nitrite reductase/ring-hydroxylating ferredoxin subunit
MKRGDEVFALDATCTHAGGPLDEGTVEGDVIVCPWHGSRFCLRSGAVLSGPATVPARNLRVRIKGGMVECATP